MSADNWTTCPRCKARAAALQAERFEAARAAYGKVPPEEYERLRAAAQEGEDLEDTLREDYHVGVSVWGSKAVFSVGYRGSCQSCGFLFRFKHE